LQEAGCLTYQESPDMSDVMTIFSGGDSPWEMALIGKAKCRRRHANKLLISPGAGVAWAAAMVPWRASSPTAGQTEGS